MWKKTVVSIVKFLRKLYIALEKFWKIKSDDRPSKYDLSKSGSGGTCP